MPSKKKSKGSKSKEDRTKQTNPFLRPERSSVDSEKKNTENGVDSEKITNTEDRVLTNGESDSEPEILGEFDTTDDKSVGSSAQSKTSRTSKGGGIFSGLFRRSRLDETYTHSLYESLTSFSTRMVGGNSGAGTLKRSEFIASGDFLVSLDPSWEWSFNPEKMIVEFPPDKQYLVNRAIPCLKLGGSDERFHLDVKENELWTLYDQFSKDGKVEHFYDLSLTYDPSTGTPRIWLFGYNLEGNPLASEEIVDDMSIEFVGTVATQIPHPVSNVLNVSIHPCKHAEVMANLIKYENLRTDTESDENYQPNHYMVLFIRLINHIFPNLMLEVPKL